MQTKNNRNYYIDFLKFIFSIMIVFYHSWVFTGIFGAGYFNRGYYAVDFYFIVTGFLFIKSIEKLTKKKSKENLGKLDLQFVRNRLKPLLPSMILIYLIGYILVYHNSLFDYHILFSDQTISEFSFLGLIGNGMSINLGCWYISVMLILFFILFPIAYKYQKTYNYYIAPILIILTLGLIGYHQVNITDPLARNYIFINGFYKGIVFINLGVIAYELCNYLKTKKLTKQKKICITIIESLIYLFLLLNMHYGIAGSYLIAILFLLGVAITFSNTSYTANIFHSKIFQQLGKFGFILYLTNIPVRTFVASSFTYSYHKMLLIYWLITIFLSIIIYVLAEVVWPKAKELKRNKRKGEKI